MKDPILNDSEFNRDIILSSSTLITAWDIANATDLELRENKILIDARNSFSFSVEFKCPDLSEFNSLSLSLRSLTEFPILVGMTLKHGDSEGDQIQKTTSFSGGREILGPGPVTALQFPIESFGVYGTPVGWTNVTGAEITFSTEKFHKDSKDIKIEFHGIQAETRLNPQGPRLTSNGLKGLMTDEASYYQTFRNHHPKSNLITSCRVVNAQNVLAAFSAQDPGLFVPPPHNYPHETWSDVMNGRIMGQVFPHEITWDANPLGELEWTHFLNRHHFLRSLVQEFIKSGNKQAVERLTEVMANWIRKCPVPVGSNGGAGPTWETLTTAWRLREWFWIVGIMWPSNSFPEEIKELMLRSIWEHAQSLMDHQGHPNNWIIVESSALTLAGLFFPLFRDASRWYETGLNRLVSEHNRQFFPDGTHFELSPLYHSICINALLEVRQVAETSGTLLPPIFYAPLEKSFEYLMTLARPDFTWPSINDSGSVDRNYCQLFAKAAHVFQRPDFEWAASRGKSGKPPERNTGSFPDSGIFVINDFEEKHPRWALFRAGPAGAFHVHNDFLSLEIFDDGASWLVDPGITRYAPNILTSSYRSALAHNVVLVGGIEPQRMGLPILERIKPSRESVRFHEGDGFVAVSGGFDELKDLSGNACNLKRTLIFLKNGIWIVLEHILGLGFHEIIHNWQFSTYVRKVKLEKRNKIVAYGKSGGFVIRMMSPTLQSKVDQAYGATNPPRGWVSTAGTDQPAHCVRFRTKTPLPSIFCWLMYGLNNEGAAPLGIEITKCFSGQPSIIIHHVSNVSEALNIPT
jgi:hypothetical protein